MKNTDPQTLYGLATVGFLITLGFTLIWVFTDNENSGLAAAISVGISLVFTAAGITANHTAKDND